MISNKKSYKLCAMACVLCTALYPLQLFGQTQYERFYKNGLDLAREKNYVAAIPYFNQALLYDSSHAESYYNRGYCEVMVKDFQSAVSDFTKSLSLYKEQPDALFWRGQCYLVLYQYSQAITDFTSELKLQNQDADTYFARGESYFQIKQYDSAMEDYKSVLRFGKNSVALEKLALSFYNMGKADSTLKYADLFLRSDSADNQILEAKMYSEARLNLPDSALKTAQKYIRLHKEEDKAYCFMANIHFREAKYNDAIEDCNAALETNSGSGEAYYIRGGCQLALNEHDKACADFFEAYQLQFPLAANMINQYCR